MWRCWLCSKSANRFAGRSRGLPAISQCPTKSAIVRQRPRDDARNCWCRYLLAVSLDRYRASIRAILASYIESDTSIDGPNGDIRSQTKMLLANLSNSNDIYFSLLNPNILKVHNTAVTLLDQVRLNKMAFKRIEYPSEIRQIGHVQQSRSLVSLIV